MKIIESMSTSVDIFGLNCGCGPAHMFKLLQNNHETIINKNLVISCMPNAGYASIENNRTVFTASPDYFSEGAAKISGVYSDIIGGCCGTTPEHIRKLAERLNKSGYNKEQSAIKQVEVKNELHIKERVKNNFSSRLLNNEFVIAVEFSPPSHSNIDPLIDGAKMLKQAGADIITLSDSPLARVKMDSVITASRIARSSGIEALPHLCCRDRNVNSLRSVILGAHAEGIRSVLAVTGDLVPESERGYVKPVFNISSSKLMQLINEMNEDVFKGDPMFIGGALNTSAINKSSELTKALRKINNGCRFFLTQPVYSLDAMDLIMEVRKHAKVLVGIMPIVSYRNAMYLKNEVPGFKIPDEIVQKFSPDMSKDEAVETGISLALQLCEKIREHADGFYFVTPFNKAEIICRLIKR